MGLTVQWQLAQGHGQHLELERNTSQVVAFRSCNIEPVSQILCSLQEPCRVTVPASPHFKSMDLSAAYNFARQDLEEGLRPSEYTEPGYGNQSYWGIPFDLGAADSQTADVLLLKEREIRVDLPGIQASYVVFLHCVEDAPTPYWPGMADWAIDGNWVGTHVSSYAFLYADGTMESVPIRRRIAIQQLRIGWGASAFEAMPFRMSQVNPTVMEALGWQEWPPTTYGRGEVRHGSGRETENLWLYAMPNPHPERPLAGLLLTPADEASTIYAISTTQLAHHPLRWEPRRKLRLAVPPGLKVTDSQDVQGLELDMGRVISARSILCYDHSQWNAVQPEVQPEVALDQVIVECTGHPQARLYALREDQSDLICELGALGERAGNAVTEVPAAERPVTLRFIEQGSGQTMPVRLHMHGAHGEYLPPKGNHRRVNPHWFEDNYGEYVNGSNQYAYVAGECVADLPLGSVYVEVVCGLEMAPVRQKIEITADTEVITLALERKLHWRAYGWVTADTHVHFLSPTTALLEGAAEGVNVVNLLASQWGEMFSNVSDFDGRTTLGAKEFGGDGEFLVRVGTENRMQVLGHVSLLGYSGQMIHPLCTGGPDESAIGDAQENTIAQWSQRCIDQGGLVIMPHAPNPQGERAADIVLGLIHGMEMMTMNPYQAQIRAYGLADWYRFLNLGYHLPVVGGSDKMSASALLGGVRTYACVGQSEFTYENWMQAVKDGYTFVTIGPLVDFTVEGQHPGQRVALPASGGSIDVEWRVESVRMPIQRVEVLQGGRVVQRQRGKGETSISGTCTLQAVQSSWIAIRVRGAFTNYTEQIAAHSSAVMVDVAGSPHFNNEDAVSILSQIKGTQAYVDTLAPRPGAKRFEAMRMVLEQAYNRLHQRLHRQGVYHSHTGETPVH